jgi:hypothetical protein
LSEKERENERIERRGRENKGSREGREKGEGKR